ncbi:MAG: hypothetical protein NWF07_03860 [Candidatus Bathyarchaeota archaeon]|nr:hypothetical protein [Candidatus Bathyarchaeota archaeon]
MTHTDDHTGSLPNLILRDYNDTVIYQPIERCTAQYYAETRDALKWCKQFTGNGGAHLITIKKGSPMVMSEF